MSKDLGTYYARVEYEGGSGHITAWNTGFRWTHGTAEESPLTATLIKPTWDSEEDLFGTILSMYLDGNYSCDCNKRLSLARAAQLPEPEQDNNPCGDTITIRSIKVMRPTGDWVQLEPE